MPVKVLTKIQIKISTRKCVCATTHAGYWYTRICRNKNNKFPSPLMPEYPGVSTVLEEGRRLCLTKRRFGWTLGGLKSPASPDPELEVPLVSVAWASSIFSAGPGQLDAQDTPSVHCGQNHLLCCGLQELSDQQRGCQWDQVIRKSCVWDWLSLEEAVKLRMQGPTVGHCGQHLTPSLQNCGQSASARDWSKPAAPRSNRGGDSDRKHQTFQYLSQVCQLWSFRYVVPACPRTTDGPALLILYCEKLWIIFSFQQNTLFSCCWFHKTPNICNHKFLI